MNAFRWIAPALLLLLCGSLQAAEPKRFYYLAVPSAPADCLFFTCVQFDAQGKPIPAPKGKGPFFTFWRSVAREEKAPESEVKKPGDWQRTLELRARQAVAAKPEIARLPAPLVAFFVELEKRRAASVNPALVVEPLYPSSDNQYGLYAYPGWVNAAHLDVMAVPDTLGPTERPKKLLQSMHAPEKEQAQDLGAWMKMFLGSLGQTPLIHLQSCRYFPEYNVFLFEAGAEFKETMELLFTPT